MFLKISGIDTLDDIGNVCMRIALKSSGIDKRGRLMGLYEVVSPLERYLHTRRFSFHYELIFI